MGIGKKEARELAAKIIAIPKKHETKIHADASGAKKGARDAQGAINGVHGKTVHITVKWSASGKGAALNAPGGGIRKYGATGGLITKQGFIRRAGGGPVPGYSSSSKADNIDAALTAGEYVHQVPAVRFWGGGFMQAVNHRDLRTVRSMVNNGGGGGGTTVVNQYFTLPNYVGSHNDLVSALTTLKRQARLDAVLR
jgi:hypothetical protein